MRIRSRQARDSGGVELMTLTADRQLGDVAQIHVLSIGVGSYRYLPGGTSAVDGAPNLSQLTSPPNAAIRFAQQLFDRLQADGLKVGTIEMALSPAQTVNLGLG